jgi:D-glycero-alpha-D-manno-heptose-7-phosphate kinase
VGVALTPASTAYVAAAPVRLDLAGGWTDVPPFSAQEGGLVVTAALELFARAEIRPGGKCYRLISEDLRDELEVADVAGLIHDGRLDLLKAAIRTLPVEPCTLITRSEAPPGSGLGSSGALDVALVAALSAARGEEPDATLIAATACHLESVEAQIPGGRQDQFASAHGGFLRLEFHDPDAIVHPLQLEEEFVADLERRTLLCYTSASRFSGNTISRVMKAYQRGESKVSRALRGLRAVAEEMTDALLKADSLRVGRLLSKNWEHQLELDPAMRTSTMARVEEAVMSAGALGGKAAGSGAGGCMFFLCQDDPTESINAARSQGAEILPVRWARAGVRLC